MAGQGYEWLVGALRPTRQKVMRGFEAMTLPGANPKALDDIIGRIADTYFRRIPLIFPRDLGERLLYPGGRG